MIPGKQIFLLPIERHDIVTLYEWIKKEESIYTLSFNKLFPLSLDELEQWYNFLINNPKNKAFVIKKAENKLSIGVVELSNIDWRNRNAEIGIYIGYQNLRNKGLGTDTLNTLIKYSFHTLNLHKLIAKILSNNIPSIKLFQKLNFKQEGILRENIYDNNQYIDLFIFGLLKSEYTPL